MMFLFAASGCLLGHKTFDEVIDSLDCPTEWADDDGDGFGGELIQVCPGDLIAFTNVGGDCDDGNFNVHPEAPELCDGVDNNCNDLVDESLPTTPHYADADNDGFGSGPPNFLCGPTSDYPVESDGDCMDTNDQVYPGHGELCDGLDNNCNGTADEGIEQFTFYEDNDGDGVGNSNASILRCAASPGHVAVDGDCDDTDASISQSTIRYIDGDGDGALGTQIEPACVAPGTPSPGLPTDCNDVNPSIYPGAIDYALDGIDQDCSGDDAECGRVRIQDQAHWQSQAILVGNHACPDVTYELAPNQYEQSWDFDIPTTVVCDRSSPLQVCTLTGTHHFLEGGGVIGVDLVGAQDRATLINVGGPSRFDPNEQVDPVFEVMDIHIDAGPTSSILSMANGTLHMDRVDISGDDVPRNVGVLLNDVEATVTALNISDWVSSTDVGGAWMMEGGSLDLASSRFENNRAADGSSLHLTAVATSFEGCTFHNNAMVGSTGSGAVVSREGSVLIDQGSVFSDNQGTWAAALFSDQADLTLNDTLFTGNVGTSAFGPFSFRNGILIGDRVRFDTNQNNATGPTGTIARIQGLQPTSRLSDSQFTNNTSTNALLIANRANDAFRLERVELHDNDVDTAIRVQGTSTILDHVRVARNQQRAPSTDPSLPMRIEPDSNGFDFFVSVDQSTLIGSAPVLDLEGTSMVMVDRSLLVAPEGVVLTPPPAMFTVTDSTAFPMCDCDFDQDGQNDADTENPLLDPDFAPTLPSATHRGALLPPLP